MLLSETVAEYVFRKVKQIREEIDAYCLAPDRPDLPVEDLERVIESMYGLRIEKFLVPFEGTFVQGLMERYPDRVRIFIRKNMPREYVRFAAVKELCHVAIDQKEDWSTDGVETINELLLEFSIESDEEAARRTQSEVFAEIAAIELLYPFHHRETDIKRLSDGTTTITKLASHFKVPERVIDQATSSHYHDLALAIWGRL